jgi:hypothetical protein
LSVFAINALRDRRLALVVYSVGIFFGKKGEQATVKSVSTPR